MSRTTRAPLSHSVTADVVVVGAGVMGTACAWKLAEAGARVVVLEKSVPGAQASSAAAGILGGRAEAHGPGPMAELLLQGLGRHAVWAKALARATGIDVEYRRSGVLKVERERSAYARLVRETAWISRHEGGREQLSAAQVRKLEPALAPTAGGVRFLLDGRVDPKLFFRAVHVAALGSGVRFDSGRTVRGLIAENGRVRGVAVEGGARYFAPHVIVAAGSWSTLVPGVPLAEGAVVPARGQIVELETPAPPLSHVVSGPRCYLVPRDDGRVLVGSTVEFVGYRQGVTAEGIRDLLAAAIDLAPALAHANLRSTWSSFRPYTGDELPLIGRTEVSGLLLATGHHRNGILLAPITAEILCAIVMGRKAPVNVRPFEAARLGRRVHADAPPPRGRHTSGRRRAP